MAVRVEEGEVEREHQRVGDGWESEHALTLEGLRVLVVEDETYSREIIATVLTRSGADVRTSASAREALELLEQWKPDVLMSDIGMPNEDGYALIQKGPGAH